MNAILIALCLSAFHLSAHAAETHPVILVAERTSPMGLEQTSLVLDPSKGKTAVSFATNSNFLLDIAATTHLGHFSSPMNDIFETEYADWLEMESTVFPLKESKSTTYESPHRLKIYFQGKLLPSGSPAFREAQALLTRAWELSDWTSQDGVKVTMTKQPLPTVTSLGAPLTPKDLADLKCTPGSETKIRTFRCQIPRYGYVTLKRP